VPWLDSANDKEVGAASRTSTDPVAAAPDDDEAASSGVDIALGAVDLLTDFIPFVSEVKAAGQLAFLAVKLKDALDRDDQLLATRIGVQMAAAAADLAPGPNVAGIAAKTARIVERLPQAARAAQIAWKRNRSSARFKRNKRRGARFEKKAFSHINRVYGNARTQITVLTKNGYRIRLDVAVRRRDGTIEFVELKSGKAWLSKNQEAGFEDLRKHGGEIRGKGKENFEGGTQLPPTRVRVVAQSRIGRKKGRHGTSRRRRD
jgi:hypothetical protein